MVFMGVTMQNTPGKRKAHAILCRITRRLDLWEIRQNTTLCADIATEERLCPYRTPRNNKETYAGTFNSKVINGKTRAAVRGIRGQGHSGVL